MIPELTSAPVKHLSSPSLSLHIIRAGKEYESVPASTSLPGLSLIIFELEEKAGTSLFLRAPIIGRLFVWAPVTYRKEQGINP